MENGRVRGKAGLVIEGISFMVGVGHVGNLGKNGAISKAVMLCVCSFLGMLNAAGEFANWAGLCIEKSIGILGKDSEGVMVPRGVFLRDSGLRGEGVIKRDGGRGKGKRRRRGA